MRALPGRSGDNKSIAAVAMLDGDAMSSLRAALGVVLLSVVWYYVSGLRMPLPSLLPAAQVQPSRLPPDPRPLPPNTALRKAQRLFEGQVLGSESVAVGPDGALYMLNKFGYLLRAQSNGTSYELSSEHPVAYVGPGRPLGFHFDAAGNLLICDSLKGLTMLEAGTGRLEVLANRASPQSHLAPGSPINYANDLDIAPDGRVFFSDATAIPPALNKGGWYDTMRSYMLTVWQGGATGRLLVYDPSTRQTQVLSEGFWFANGVALSPDGAFVAVVETASMRVHRYWLAGPKAGTTDLLITNLLGFPDGITSSSDGNFWLSLIVPDQPLLRRLMPYRPLRWLMAWVTQLVTPKLKEWGMVVKVSPEGEVVQVLQDPGGLVVSYVSAVTEHAGSLFLGNLAKDYVSVVALEEVQQ